MSANSPNTNTDTFVSTSPTKRLKISEIVDQKKTLIGQKVYVRLVQGSIELWNGDREIGEDAFLNDIRQEIKDPKSWASQNGFIQVAIRRISITDNHKLINDSSTWARIMLVRIVNQSTPESRRKMGQVLVHRLNNYQQRKPYAQQATQFSKQNERKPLPFVLPPNFDQTVSASTEEELPRAEQFVRDQSIIELIHMIYPKVDSSWATREPIEAKRFFAGPTYSQVVTTELGFIPNSDLHPNFHLPEADLPSPDNKKQAHE